MRYAIRRNHGAAAPSSFVVVDTETIPVPVGGKSGACCHRLNLGYARAFRLEGGRQTRQGECLFREPAVFWEWLAGRLDRKRPTWVWAHNLGFDLTALRFWERLTDRHFTLSLPSLRLDDGRGNTAKVEERRGSLVTEDPPTLVTCWDRERRHIRFVDTMNFAPIKLEAIGAMLGVEKLPMPGEVADDGEWERYCVRDVEILEKAVLAIVDFVQRNDLGNFRSTLASQAMHFYRHRCLTCEIFPDDRDDVKLMERAAYYAPRCTPHYLGHVIPPGQEGVREMLGIRPHETVLPAGPVYCLDLTAAYPAVMQGRLYPVAFRRTAEDWEPQRLQEHMQGWAAVAHVSVACESEPLPVRTRRGVVWRTGSFSTVLAGPELLRALSMRQIKRVHRAQLYTADEPFDAFVREGWKLRQDAKSAGRPFDAMLAKGLLTSLHGKFGQQAHRWEVLAGHVAPVPWGYYTAWNVEEGKLEQRRAVGWDVQIPSPGGETKDNFPLISAYCTSYHRERMAEAMRAAGYRHTLYQSADSLHVTQTGYLALCKAGWVESERIGAFKTELVADRAHYRGPKDYTVGDKVVKVGLSSRAVVDQRGLWHQTNFARLESLLSSNPPPGPMTWEQVADYPCPQTDGRVTAEGWVLPLESRHEIGEFSPLLPDTPPVRSEGDSDLHEGNE